MCINSYNEFHPEVNNKCQKEGQELLYTNLENKAFNSAIYIKHKIVQWHYVKT
jgi:hypothetical protein